MSAAPSIEAESTGATDALGFRACRLDEVLGEWKPFRDVIENSIWRACEAHRVACGAADVAAPYDAILVARRPPQHVSAGVPIANEAADSRPCNGTTLFATAPKLWPSALAMPHLRHATRAA